MLGRYKVKMEIKDSEALLRVFHESVPHCEAEQNVNNISFFGVVIKAYYRMDTLEREGLHQLNTAVRL